MLELFANSGDSDQLLSVATDLGLHCLLITLLGVSRLKWINTNYTESVNHETDGKAQMSLTFTTLWANIKQMI